MLAAATVRLHTSMTNASPPTPTPWPKLDSDCVSYISTESQMFEVKKTQSSQEHLPWSMWDHCLQTPFPHPSLMSTEATHKQAAPGGAPGAGGLHEGSAYKELMGRGGGGLAA